MKYFPILLLFVAIHAWGADYYVAEYGNDETGDGSAEQPWASIQKAADSVGPGATVHVAPGTYWQSIVTQTSGTGDEGGRITFISDASYGALIRNSEIAQWLNYGSYVDIIGFDISGSGSQLGILSLGSFVRIIGNHVHDICQHSWLSEEYSCAGIDHGLYTSVANDTLSNFVHDIGPFDTMRSAHGIYHAVNGGTIDGNVIYGTLGYGIHLWHAADGVTITNNIVYQTGKYIPEAGAGMGGGILVGSGDAGASGIDNSFVAYNVVFGNAGLGIGELGYVGANNVYVDNWVSYNNPDWMLRNGNPEAQAW